MSGFGLQERRGGYQELPKALAYFTVTKWFVPLSPVGGGTRIICMMDEAEQ